MKDYFRESVRRDIPNWGKVNHCKNHNMYVNTRLSWEGSLTRKSLDFDFQLNLDDHWPTTWRLSWKGGQFFSFNNPRSKITFNFEQSTKEDLRTLYSKKKTSWCFLESQSMECKWSKNKILYNAVNIKYFPNYYEGQAFASCTTLSSRKRNLPGLIWYSQYMCCAQNGKFNSNVSKTLKRRKTRQGQTRLSYTAVSVESPCVSNICTNRTG